MLLVVVGLFLAQAGLWIVDRGLRQHMQHNLQTQAESLLAALVKGPQGIELNSRHHDAVFLKAFSGHYFIVEFNQQRWRSRSLWDFELPKVERLGFSEQLRPGPEEQQLLIYQGQYRRYKTDIKVTVAHDYSPVLQSFRQAQIIGGGLGLLALLLTLLLQWRLVRRALRPLEQTRVQIEQLQLGQRSFLEQDTPIELQPLVQQVNRLLVHTEDTLKRSRKGLGNLGHALKTPLAVLMSVLRREELQRQPELSAVLKEQLEYIDQRISRELTRARLSGEALPGAYFNCAEELPGLFQLMNRVHGDVLTLHWHATAELRLPYERDDILEMLGNLLDNACKWADSRVELSIESDGESYCVRVDDDGPGIEESQREQVQQRGSRLDEHSAGHGLGLGIVRDIVETLHGTLQLLNSPLGGLRVEIRLQLRT
ncbi:HAMP domain-containing protein [Pseudomonas sp. C27(2019)]|uniref:ATP-binding protein n=1 Tax=Pseudomonas sp. C27(2019) TaxID=2604941 RepID=UPI0012456B85|nr:ATP-binding protein [Pseudomonas sp. C27(2019)]QEY60354.1 HAMP domain-containing protein [Pseudomonas sp. C27(2019)]